MEEFGRQNFRNMPEYFVKYCLRVKELSQSQPKTQEWYQTNASRNAHNSKLSRSNSARPDTEKQFSIRI